METITGKDFEEFWAYASEKGLMKSATARALQSAVRQVIRVEDNWQELDITQLDVDQLLNRFKNTRAKDYKPESMADYEKRFRLALKKFLEFKRDPSSWKSGGQQNSSRKSKTEKSSSAKSGAIIEDVIQSLVPQTMAMGTQLMEYPFPLREGCVVRLKLPMDLKTSEVDRLGAFMRTIASDFAPESR